MDFKNDAAFGLNARIVCHVVLFGDEADEMD